MARQRISEFRAKSLVFSALGLPYSGVSITTTSDISSQLSSLDTEKRYVVKVDQGVKKRMKRGLIGLNKSVDEIPGEIKRIADQGFTSFIIEPMADYASQEERYFAIERQRDGYLVSVSQHGGIEVEDHADEITNVTLPYTGDRQQGMEKIQEVIAISFETLTKILAVFDEQFFSFLEINPLITSTDTLHIIDMAVEVDSVADFFVNGGWTPQDFTHGEVTEKTSEEIAVEDLKRKSQAAFTLNVLNHDGSIFMLLSGGGASLVLADEVANLGKGKELANYGEYSGNPSEEETYLYTKQVLSLLLKSQAPKKVLIIGGGVANFTDVRITFRGVIKALDEKKDDLRSQNVKVFVRRGGPNQKEGLSLMKSFLDTENLYGNVVGPDIVLTEIVTEALNTIT